MSNGDVQSLSSNDSDENNLVAMDARSCDYSDDEFTLNRRNRITRGRGANNRERSLTPTGEGRRGDTQKVPPPPKEGKTEDKDEPSQHVQLKIQPRKVPSMQEGITQKSADLATTTSNGLTDKEVSNGDDSEYRGTEDEEEKHEDEEEKYEVLATRDPRFVPKATLFYMHDTLRSTTLKERIPFADEEQEDDTSKASAKGEAFKPTKSGK